MRAVVRTGLWLAGGALVLLLAALVALWLWADTPGSLARALGWAERWTQQASASPGRLHTESVEGSLRGGGRIGTLRWSQDGFSVQAEGVSLQWGDALWTDALRGRGLHIPSLAIRSLRVDDQRSPTPSEPPTDLSLPLPLSLGFSVDQFELTGRQALSASEIVGHYRYAALSTPTEAPTLPDTPGVNAAHRLRLDSLQWAEGRYRGQLNLGAQAPLPLALALQGEVRGRVPDGTTLSLHAAASVSGTLAGVGAALDIRAQAQPADGATGPDATTLSLTARVLPWADQPLHSADANARALNLALLWPTAPVTALSGQLKAQPDGDGWRARVQLDNAREGPADQRGLPLQQLQADVRQLGDRWTVSALQARLGGGTLQGQASFALGTAGGAGATALTDWQGELQAKGVQATRLWSTLPPGVLDGSASARAAPAPAPAGAIDLQAQLAAVGARLQGQGRLEPAQRSLQGRWGLDLPGARLDWDGQAAHGSGQGELRARLDNPSRLLDWVRGLRSLPVWSASARDALASLDRLRVDNGVNARLQWSGGLAALGWPAPATASTPASVPPPRLQATLNLPGLGWQGGDGAAPLRLDGVVLNANGPLDALALTAAGAATTGGWRLGLDAGGQLGIALASGRLDLARLQLRLGPEPASARVPGWRLANTTPLRLAWTLDPTAGPALDAGTGALALSPLPGTATAPDTPLTLDWQRLVWQADTLDTRGRLQGLSLPWLEAFAALGQAPPSPLASNGLGGDLVLDGDWDLRLPANAADTLTLAASLQRRSGDLRWNGGNGGPEAPLSAGVRDARLSLNVQDRRVQAALRWDTERLGQASADLSSTLGSGSAGSDDPLERWWPANAPLSGSAQVRLPQVGVWSLLAPPGWRMQGTLSADARLGGTRGSPAWTGNLQADELALRSVVDGIAFTNGQLRATLAGERIRVDRFSLQGPGGAASGGTLEASGQAEWRSVPGSLLRQPYIELKAQAQRLRISSRPDRRLTLSGDASATLDGRLLQLRGQLRADSALFILPDESTPSLGDDVVVRSTRDLPVPAGTGQRVQPDVSVTLDLGPQFEVRGQGLEARLEGQLSVRATPALPTPRVLGEVRTVNGTYRAYDQKLRIESGVLRFTGPYDDPALDIRAVRVLPENTNQRVGVQLSGNAQAPRVSLFADPDLPDGDKLAWLVLGRPASAAGAQAFVLQQAARRLLSSGGEPLDGALARTLGIDEIGFSGSGTNADGTTTGAALTLGKRLSSDLYLSYEQSLAGAMSTVSILYDLSRRLTLRARAGTENAVDLIFTHRYD
ncbi:translocation/assembly module TamB domain-containing protein [Hydrogenophaga pseudoflava]|uniref:translocation/assembly module TamB domain-containing protein n=1 Tax=Hydrogenophaga pseudoflava TaxID=47421 RepID=UPI0027E54010|nr:translocation/assembly module TamB domain-containing protein [Hydrogenophaga pseudoflava]MDQ7744899.1 translocation/assembly module TamB domain-containing protein [Hydrogenophaga pseudoflava]